MENITERKNLKIDVDCGDKVKNIYNNTVYTVHGTKGRNVEVFDNKSLSYLTMTMSDLIVVGSVNDE